VWKNAQKWVSFRNILLSESRCFVFGIQVELAKKPPERPVWPILAVFVQFGTVLTEVSGFVRSVRFQLKCPVSIESGHLPDFRVGPPRWHPPGGCHLHRDIGESYTFHRWIEVDLIWFFRQKSTSKPTA